jgi:hypothetical protein
MSKKDSNDAIGNRTRDFPVCSAVPQPMRHRVPLLLYVPTALILTRPGILIHRHTGSLA